MKNFSISFLTLTTSQNRGGYFPPTPGTHSTYCWGSDNLRKDESP